MATPSSCACRVPPSSGLPAIETVPASGTTEPATTPIIVDLPAPFSPTRPTTSPLRSTRWSTSSTTAGPSSWGLRLRTRSPPVPAVLPVDDGLTGANCLVVGEIGRQVRLRQRPHSGADHAGRLERLHDRCHLRAAKHLHRRGDVGAQVALHERLLEDRGDDRAILQPRDRPRLVVVGDDRDLADVSLGDE